MDQRGDTRTLLVALLALVGVVVLAVWPRSGHRDDVLPEVSLFRGDGAVPAHDPLPTPPWVRRQGIAEITPEAAAALQATPGTRRTFRLNFFPDQALTAVLESRRQRLDRTWWWTAAGKKSCFDTDEVQILYAFDACGGTESQIALMHCTAAGPSHGWFEVIAMGKRQPNRYLVRELDPHGFPRCGNEIPGRPGFERPPEQLDPDRRHPPEPLPDQKADAVTVDILVLYTQAAIDKGTPTGDESALRTNIMAAVAQADRVFRVNSETGVDLELVRCQKVDLDEEAHCYDAGGHVKSTWVMDALGMLDDTTDGILDDVHDLRKDAEADIVVLVLGIANLKGVANVLPQSTGTPAEAFACHAFAVVSAGTMNDYVLAHEVAHVFGGCHEASSTTCTAPSDLSHAHAWKWDVTVEVDPDPNDDIVVPPIQVGLGTVTASTCDLICPFLSRKDPLSSGEVIGSSDADNTAVVKATGSLVASFSETEDCD